MARSGGINTVSRIAMMAQHLLDLMVLKNGTGMVSYIAMMVRL
jgi:hypothetical protein